MNKKAKSALSLVLSLVFLLALLPGGVLAANVIAEGEFGAEGNNLSWTLDSNGVLTIQARVPWRISTYRGLRKNPRVLYPGQNT